MRFSTPSKCGHGSTASSVAPVGSCASDTMGAISSMYDGLVYAVVGDVSKAVQKTCGCAKTSSALFAKEAVCPCLLFSFNLCLVVHSAGLSSALLHEREGEGMSVERRRWCTREGERGRRTIRMHARKRTTTAVSRRHAIAIREISKKNPVAHQRYSRLRSLLRGRISWCPTA
jgi:hypothetical protein